MVTAVLGATGRRMGQKTFRHGSKSPDYFPSFWG
jgi:hypothetical protein